MKLFLGDEDVKEPAGKYIGEKNSGVLKIPV